MTDEIPRQALEQLARDVMGGFPCDITLLRQLSLSLAEQAYALGLAVQREHPFDAERLGLLIDRDALLRREMCAYLDTLVITGDNIGDIRRSLFLPFDSPWNGWVRDDTAARERATEGGSR